LRKLAEFMTGRAVFIHIGATLGIILVNDMNQRPLRIARNAVLAPAVLLLMVSNHFPLIYGTSRPAHRPDARRVGVRDRPLAEMAVETSEAGLKAGTTFCVGCLRSADL
jgi:hypothetical protein